MILQDITTLEELGKFLAKPVHYRHVGSNELENIESRIAIVADGDRLGWMVIEDWRRSVHTTELGDDEDEMLFENRRRRTVHRPRTTGKSPSKTRLMKFAPTMLGILRRMVSYDFQGDAIGIIPYDGCLEEILEVLGQVEGGQG